MLLEYANMLVQKRWYRVYWAFMSAANLSFVGLYAAAHTKLLYVSHSFGSDPVFLILVGCNLLYLLVFYWFAAHRSLPFATFVGTLFFIISVLAGLTFTGTSTIAFVFITAWIISSFLCGVFGLQFLVGAAFLTLLYVLSHNHFMLNHISTRSTTLLVVEFFAVLFSYFFWRNKFENLENQKVSELSTMLKSNQQQSDVLLRSIADGIIVTDTEGKITLMNPTAAAMTEWDSKEAHSVDVQLVVKLTQENGNEIAKEKNPFNLVVSSQKPINQTLQLVSQNGKKIFISLVISPLMSADNTMVGAVAVMRDISEERKTQQQRAEFISTASHEMRTPVAAIEGYLELALNEKVSTVDDRAKGFLEKAQASTQHLGQLFQDLLTSSKAEDGRLSSFPVPVEMASFVQQTTEDIRFAAEKKNLSVEFVMGDPVQTASANTSKDAGTQHMLKPLYYALIDPVRMREVITNLFDNACKYTDHGKITVGLTANVSTIQVYVHDTGAGIPADDIPHLFQKFYRIDNSATRTIGGTGLGLFICRKIVELYHGHIWVESKMGQGSTFYIALPRLSQQQAAALQPISADDSGQKPPSDK